MSWGMQRYWIRSEQERVHFGRNTAVELMEKIRSDVIRGNISEVKHLAQGSGTTKGVDADGQMP